MLWTQKLSDNKLRDIMDKVEDLLITGVTGDEELRNLAETWYDNSVGMERFMALSIDVWKEAAFRWINNMYMLPLSRGKRYGVYRKRIRTD